MEKNEFFEMFNQESSPLIETLLKNAKQRAAVMALLTMILREQDDTLTIHNVKVMIANFFSHLIDEDSMVGDEIDKSVMGELVMFVQQEELLEAFKN